MIHINIYNGKELQYNLQFTFNGKGIDNIFNSPELTHVKNTYQAPNLITVEFDNEEWDKYEHGYIVTWSKYLCYLMMMDINNIETIYYRCNANGTYNDITPKSWTGKMMDCLTALGNYNDRFRKMYKEQPIAEKVIENYMHKKVEEITEFNDLLI